MANKDVWDAIVQTDGAPANSFEFLLDIYYGGSFHRTADITDLNPAFTAKNRSRETYAAKGVDSAMKYGFNLSLTWNHEPIRDAVGAFQPELNALFQADRAVGIANIMRLRAYDALGADYAFDGDFSISVSRSGTGADEKAWYTITATLVKFRGWITNPVISGNKPQIDNVDPDTAATGATVYIEGVGFTGTTGVTGVKFGTTNATSYTVVNDGLIAAVVPAGTEDQSMPITVTNSTGTSDPLAWVHE